MDRNFFSLQNLSHKESSFLFQPIIIYVVIFLAVIFFCLTLYDKISLSRFAKNPSLYSSYYDFVLDRAAKIQLFVQWLWHPFISEEYLLLYANQLADKSELLKYRLETLLKFSFEKKSEFIRSVFPKSSNTFHTLDVAYYDLNL